MVTQLEQDKFFQASEDVWKKSKEIYELVDNFDNGENIEKTHNEEDLSIEVLENLSKEIKELKKSREDLTRVSIGYMYNGVLVSGDISCRRGKVYRFRCQYALSNKHIKKSILKNLQEVEKKLSEPNMDILETLLEFIDENEPSYHTNSEEHRILDLNDFRIAEFRDDGVRFKVIAKLILEEDGELKAENDNGRTMSLDKYSKNMLMSKLKDELSKLSADFIASQTIKRDTLKSEVDTIKSKARNLLMLREMDRQNE